MQDLRINTGIVRAAGQELATTGETLAGALSGLADAAAAPAASGFHVDRAIAALSQKWHADIEQAAAKTVAFGEATVVSANAYDDREDLNARLGTSVVTGEL